MPGPGCRLLCLRPCSSVERAHFFSRFEKIASQRSLGHVGSPGPPAKDLHPGFGSLCKSGARDKTTHIHLGRTTRNIKRDAVLASSPVGESLSVPRVCEVSRHRSCEQGGLARRFSTRSAFFASPEVRGFHRPARKAQRGVQWPGGLRAGRSHGPTGKVDSPPVFASARAARLVAHRAGVPAVHLRGRGENLRVESSGRR